LVKKTLTKGREMIALLLTSVAIVAFIIVVFGLVTGIGLVVGLLDLLRVELFRALGRILRAGRKRTHPELQSSDV
jgi:uncharacterized membrane protein